MNSHVDGDHSKGVADPLAAVVAGPWAGMVLRALDRILEILTASLLVAIVAAVFISTASRYVFNASVIWSEEIPVLLQVWLTFVGGVIGQRRGAHVSVETFVNMTPRRWRPAIDAFGDCVTLGLLIVLLYGSALLVRDRMDEVSSALRFSMSLFMLPLSIGAAAMIVAICLRIVAMPRRPASVGVVVFVLVASGVWLANEGSGGLLTAVSPLAFMIGAFLVLLVLNVPIAFALGAVSLAHMLLTGGSNVTIVAQRLVSGQMGFVLIAVPLFILAGALMETGGISRRLVALAAAIVGHIRGGLAVVVVVSEILFSGISGSSVADVSAIGSLLIPAMVRAGYRPETSVAIVSAASAMGILVPPCILMVILAAVGNVSVIALFVGGFIPAFVIATGLIALIIVKARREDWPKEERKSAGDVLRAGVDAIIPLLSPVIIFGGMLSGIVTVTEAAVLAVVYGLVVGVFVYGELGVRKIGRMLVDSGVMTSMAFWIIGMASVFSWILAVEQVPDELGRLISGAPGGAATFWLFSIAVFVIIGGMLDGMPALLILGPVFFPIATALHIDLIHYGIVIIAAMGIGLFLPGIGVGTFIAVAIGRVQLGPVAVAFVPYLAVLLVMVIVVAFVPWFTLVLPRLLLGR